MAEPKSRNPQELLQRLKARRRVPMMRPQIVAQPDAINETLRVDGTLQRREVQRMEAQARQQREQAQQRAQAFRRTQYRNRKRAQQAQAREAGQVQLMDLSVDLMSDQMVDAAIAREQQEAKRRARQPQIGPANPVWSYPAETRRALGYYTQEEREQAARLNDMRSSTVFGNVMPNFGRQAAFNNPGAEMEAFKGTATYFPNAVVSGMSFGLPSATTATASGLRTGWQAARATGANVGQRAIAATTTAARQAAPVVTNPRWAATTATMVTPMVAAANDGAEQSRGFWNWVGNHPMESILIGSLAYKGGRGLWNGGRGLWNKGANRLRIPAEPSEGRPARFTETAPTRGEGAWSYNPADYPPAMRREPVLDDYRIVVEQPSQPRPAAFAEVEPPKPTGRRPKKKGRAAEWDAQNQAHQEWEARRAQYDVDNADLNRQWDEYEQAQYGPTRYDDTRFQADHDEWQRTAQSDYDAAMQRHQTDVANYNAEQARLDQEYNTAVSDYNQRRTANEQAWQEYHESDPYKQWLERKNGVLNFRNRLWGGVKNNWYWVLPGGAVGYKWLTGGYSDSEPGDPTNNSNGDTAPVGSTALPAGFRPIQGVNDSTGQIVVPNSVGRPDSVINIEPITRNRFGRGNNQNQ